jgi:hypothetical protein
MTASGTQIFLCPMGSCLDGAEEESRIDVWTILGIVGGTDGTSGRIELSGPLRYGVWVG